MKLTFGGYHIRELRDADVHSIAAYADNRQIWLNLRDTFPQPYTLADATMFISMVSRQSPVTTFAIANESEAVGIIGLTIGEDVHRYTAELGFWLGEPHWGRGIMTQAVEQLTTYAFTHLKLQRIFAEVYDYNAASARVLQKAGYAYEGRLKAHAFKDGKLVDMLLYARISPALSSNGSSE